MPETKISSANPEDKRLSPFVMRIGSHPIAYSVTAILAAGTVAFFLAIVPLVRMMQPGGSASVSDALAKNEAAQAKFESQKKAVSAIAGISEEHRKMIAYALPEEPDTPGLAVQLNALVSQSGLKLTNIDMIAAPSDSSGIDAGGSSVNVMNVVVSVDGINYDKMKILLSNIESSLRLLDVRTLNFSPSSAAVTLEMRTYYINGA
jgi:hypothetical protein